MIQQFPVLFLVVLVCSSCSLTFALSSSIPRRTSIVTGANGYVGREIVHVLLNDDDDDDDDFSNDEHEQEIICLVRPARIESEEKYWKTKSACVKVLPYDMLDGGATVRRALELACRHNHNNEGSDEKSNVCLYHVASVFGPSEDHTQTAKDNVKGTEDLVATLASFKNCRLVLTSSMAAVRGSGQDPENGEHYTYKDWNTISKLGTNWGSSYQWSKAEAERRAWELAKQHDISMCTICPSFIFGPPSDGMMTQSFSITLVGQWVRGESPVQSRLCVDVRDVARAHVAAGTKPEGIGQRFIVSKEERVPSKDMAEALQQVCKESGLGDPDKITFDANFSGGAIPIGSREVASAERLKESLGITLRPVHETIYDMGQSLLTASSA
jgi:nucleoside-diphosphate-sugar epimerase